MAAENWNRRVWRLAGPIILANISVPLLGAVDTAVVGHLPGAQSIGAVAVGALIFNFIYFGFNFLRMGTTGLTAQALGAGDTAEVRASLVRALAVAAALGIGLVALQGPVAWAAFGLIDASAGVSPLANSYFSIRIWSAPAVFANFAILGWFIGVQNTRAALFLQVAMNGANMALDLWFVFGLGLGVAGVAWATLISEVGAVALGLVLVRRTVRPMGGRWRLDRAVASSRLKRMVAVNRDIFIRSLCLQAAFFLFTAMAAGMGDVVLAANAVLLIFQSLLSYGLDGFAHAAEALTGGAVGAGDRARFKGAVRATSRWALVFAGAYAVFYGALGPVLIDVITDVSEVRATARAYLPWVVLSPLVSVWSFQLDGIFIGATRTAGMRNAMAVSLALYAAAVWVLIPVMGNHGLWLAFLVLMVARAVTLALLYPRLERAVGGAS